MIKLADWIEWRRRQHNHHKVCNVSISQIKDSDIRNVEQLSQETLKRFTIGGPFNKRDTPRTIVTCGSRKSTTHQKIRKAVELVFKLLFGHSRRLSIGLVLLIYGIQICIS